MGRSLLAECRREVRRPSCIVLEVALGLDGGPLCSFDISKWQQMYRQGGMLAVDRMD